MAYTFTVPNALHARLHAVSDINGLRLSEMMRSALADYLFIEERKYKEYLPDYRKEKAAELQRERERRREARARIEHAAHGLPMTTGQLEQGIQMYLRGEAWDYYKHVLGVERPVRVEKAYQQPETQTQNLKLNLDDWDLDDELGVYNPETGAVEKKLKG